MTVPAMPTSSRQLALGVVLLVGAPVLLLAAVITLVIGTFGPLGWVYASIALTVAAFGFAIAGVIALAANRRVVWEFNPPPGWPRPPAGFTPSPSWQPDPSWPSAPDNWTWWIR